MIRKLFRQITVMDLLAVGGGWAMLIWVPFTLDTLKYYIALMVSVYLYSIFRLAPYIKRALNTQFREDMATTLLSASAVLRRQLWPQYIITVVFTSLYWGIVWRVLTFEYIWAWRVVDIPERVVIAGAYILMAFLIGVSVLKIYTIPWSVYRYFKFHKKQVSTLMPLAVWIVVAFITSFWLLLAGFGLTLGGEQIANHFHYFYLDPFVQSGLTRVAASALIAIVLLFSHWRMWSLAAEVYYLLDEEAIREYFREERHPTFQAGCAALFRRGKTPKRRSPLLGVMTIWIVFVGALISGIRLEPIDNYYDAIDRGDIMVVQELMDRGHDPHRVHPRFSTALYYAARKSQFAIVELIYQNKGLQGVEDYGVPLFFVSEALQYGSFELLEGLLTNELAEADISIYDHSLLEHGVARRDPFNPEVVDLFLRWGKRPTELLKVAISIQNIELLEYLMQERGIRLEGSEIQHAVERNSFKSLRFLTQRLGGVNAYDQNGNAAVHYYARKYTSSLGLDEQFIQWLVEQEADLNLPTEDGATRPVHLALSNYQKLKLLLQHGADATLPTETAPALGLLVATFDDQQTLNLVLPYVNPAELTRDQVPFLLEKDEYTGKAQMLHLAVFHKINNNIEPLLEAGAPTHTPDHTEWDPLHVAVFANNLRGLQMLIDAGAPINARSRHPKSLTPLGLARELERTELAEYLVTVGAEE